MIRQGSILAFAGWDKPSDLQLRVVRYDHATDLYHLQSIRGLKDSTIERWILHSWLRRKSMVIEKKGTES